MLNKIGQISVLTVKKTTHIGLSAVGLLAYGFTFLCVFYVFLWGFVNAYGKDLLLANLHKTLGVTAQVDNVSLAFPLAVNIKNFKCKDIKLGDVKVCLGGYDILRSKITIDRIYIDGLHLKIKSNQDKLSFEPVFVKDISESKKSKLGGKNKIRNKNFFKYIIAFINKNHLAFNVKSFYIHNWTGEIIDKTKLKTMRFLVRDGEINLRNFQYPNPGKFYVNMKTSLEINNKEAISHLRTKGWIDFANKDMDLDIDIANIDYWAFSDYYTKDFRPENFWVNNARISLKANLSAHNNNLVINNKLSLEKIEFRKKDREDIKSYRLTFFKKLISLLPHYQNKPIYKFMIKTSLDNPRLDFSSVKEDFAKRIEQTKKA